MLRRLNFRKIDNLIFRSNKYATYCLYSPQNHQYWSNSPTINQNRIVYRYNATDSNKKQITVVVTRKERFKKAIKEYGTTVIVFHVCISLISLGICYVIISAGFNVEAFFTWLGFTADVTSKFATKTGTFVAAYAFHKLFAPVRISITLAVTPFIVKYLRNIGWLKKPLAKQTNAKQNT